MLKFFIARVVFYRKFDEVVQQTTLLIDFFPAIRRRKFGTHVWDAFALCAILSLVNQRVLRNILLIFGRNSYIYHQRRTTNHF